MNILLKNIDIITLESTKPFIKEGCIGIKDGLIEFVEDSFKNVPADFKADKVIDGKHRLLMPGLVNTHTHSGMTIMRNFADDIALHDWLFDNVFPVEARLTDEDVFWGSLLGIAEMIKSGTTAFADMYLHMNEIARAVQESGIRANLSISPLKFNTNDKSGKVDETEKVYEFFKRWNNKADGRIKVSLEVHSTYLFDKEDLINAAHLAKELGIGIQMHLLETQREKEESIKKYGKTPAELSLECGIFDFPVIAAHCVYLSDKDMDILRDNRINVAHNPTSNLKLGSGIANIAEMARRGINLTIGTDGVASNNNLNMFEEMHIAAILQKGVHKDPKLTSAEQVLYMAASNGSEAIGFGKTAGSVQKGKKADLIILNTDVPHMCPLNNPVSAVVYSAQASDVDTVIIDGNIVMENRRLKTIDEELVMRKVSEISKRVIF